MTNVAMATVVGIKNLYVQAISSICSGGSSTTIAGVGTSPSVWSSAITIPAGENRISKNRIKTKFFTI